MFDESGKTPGTIQNRMRRLFIALFLAVAVSAAAQTKGKPFVFMPQWTAQAQFAGYYAALVKGFYAEEGLDVEIVHPFASQSNVRHLLEGDVDATMLPLAQAIESVGGGAQLVNILQTSMNSALLLISRNGADPFKMKKAKVVCWRSGYDQLARSLSIQNHLDTEWVPAASSVNLFIAGAVDGMLAMSYNEYYQILQTGLLPSGEGVFSFREMGYNVQQDGVYMTRSAFNRNRDRAEAFARASRRGWEWVANHPEEALDIVMDYVKNLRIPTNRTLQRLMLDEILRLQLDPDSGGREFRVREDMVGKASRLLYNTGLIGREVSYKELMP